jgi:AraC family transcriptional regulator, transcriptional activator of pobA
MPTFIVGTQQPHALAFHDILLVTRGRGHLQLDGEVHTVAPGVVAFSRPGEVRRWSVRGLDGACLFFSEEFVASFFSDARFLDGFAYFAPDRPRATLALRPAERRQFLERFSAMQREIAALRDDAQHALRAVLYEVLVLLNRWYKSRHAEAAAAPRGRVVRRFQGLVERDYARRHLVSDYATALGVTPGHLNALCRTQLRQTASARIHGRLALEAKRLLLYSDLTVAEVADRLGFADPAYFSRFFRREAGSAPAAYRARKRSTLA